MNHDNALKHFYFKKGNSKITLIRMEKCGQDEPGVSINFSMHKVNRTHQGINVVLDTSYDLDHTVAVRLFINCIFFSYSTNIIQKFNFISFQLNATIAKWGDGGWKPHAFDYYDGNACETFMKFGKKEFTQLLESVGRKPTCPVAKVSHTLRSYSQVIHLLTLHDKHVYFSKRLQLQGKFSVKDYIFDGKVGVQTMYGDFRADISLDKGGKSMICVRVFLKCEPPKGR